MLCQTIFARSLPAPTSRLSVHSAADWRVVLEPVIARYRGTAKRLYFRGDAAFANPEIYEFLEAEGMGYAIRLPASRMATPVSSAAIA